MKTVFWETTKLCNMHCRQCSNNSGEKAHEELSTDEIGSVCQQLINLGLKDFRFYGGEPFLRRDINEITSFLVRQNVQVAFYTNGTILNDDILSLLNTASNPRIFVSLDSASSHTHDDIRGLKGSFNLVIRNISALVSAGYRVDIIMTISKKNYTEVDEVFRLGKSLGVSSIKPNIISMIGRAKLFWNELALSPKQLAEAAKMVYNANTLYFNKKGIRKPCVAGIDELFISSSGDVYPCALLIDDKYRGGNVREKRLSEILQNPLPGFSQVVSSIRDKIFCGGCAKKDVCQGGCRARAIVDQNDISGKDIFTCSYQSISIQNGDK